MSKQGKKIRKAFLWKADGMKNVEILLRLKALGLNISHQQLTKIFKRPFYCGLIAHGMLDGKIVPGRHEGLVSQEVFLRVNNIHANAPNYGVPHEKENDMLPLKVFVRCGDCGQPFTGYLVKKKDLYYYKCRTAGCKCNVSAVKMHDLFGKELQRLSVKPELITSISYRLESFYHEVTKDQSELQVELKKQLGELDKKIDSLQENYYVLKEIDKMTFEKFNVRYHNERFNIEQKLADCSVSISNLTNYVKEAVSFSAKLNTVWTSSNVSIKERMQNLIFPKGIFYDRKKQSFRTDEVNFIFSLLSSGSIGCEVEKKGLSAFCEHLAPLAEREGFEPSVHFKGVRRFSKPFLSATQASLQTLEGVAKIGYYLKVPNQKKGLALKLNDPRQFQAFLL